jgi:hypothetical protein
MRGQEAGCAVARSGAVGGVYMYMCIDYRVCPYL